MTITPVSGTDDVTWLDAAGVKQSSIVVVATGPAGAAIGPVTSSTATLSAVASTTSAVALLAANTSRKGAAIYNTDGNALYILLAASGTPSATNASYVIPATTGYWEVPFGYTGAIRGAWAVDGTGSAYVTEFT